MFFGLPKELTMKCCHVLLALLLTGSPGPRTDSAEEKKDLGVQFAENP